MTSIVIPESVTDIDDEAFYGCDELVIFCVENSYAHTFAIENGIPYQLVVPIEKAVVTLSADSVTYDGTAKTPSVKSVTVNGKALTAGTDYSVSYKNNTNVGTASVVITGKGNYTGTVTKTFKITAKKGTTFTAGSNKYKITSSSEVAFAGLKSTKTIKVTIPKR